MRAAFHGSSWLLKCIFIRDERVEVENAFYRYFLCVRAFNQRHSTLQFVVVLLNRGISFIRVKKL